MASEIVCSKNGKVTARIRVYAVGRDAEDLARQAGRLLDEQTIVKPFRGRIDKAATPRRRPAYTYARARFDHRLHCLLPTLEF